MSDEPGKLFAGDPPMMGPVSRGAAVVDTSNQFKKQPRRASDKGKRVAISPEARQAYEDKIRALEERERTYTRHLPGPDNKPNR